MTPADMGPLPQSDRNDEQQQSSLNALRNILPETKFLVRDERTDDKGVDASLEAKVEIVLPGKSGADEVRTSFSNCRAFAQVKSIANPTPNADGSISYAMETSNLNYLLNGPSPIYILWSASTGEIRYAWARDEWRRLDAENPNWKNQQTFTIRFQQVLDAPTADHIHERIVKEARFNRQINETLSRSSFSEGVVVQIEPKSLESTDPLKLYEWIVTSGLTIVSSGFGARIVEWFGLLNLEHRSHPRIQLVVAFAQVSLGRNHEAIGTLSAAKLSLHEFSPSDQDFLGYLEDYSAFQTGRIDQTEYLRREAERASNRTGVAAACHEFEVLRQERISARDRDCRDKLLEQMRSTAAEIETATDATNAHKLNARIQLLFAEGDELAGQMTSEFVQSQARIDMGILAPGLASQAQTRLTGDWDQWNNRMKDCIDSALKERHPILLADAISSKAFVYQAVMLTQRMHAAAADKEWEPPTELIHSTMADVERAMEIYRLAGNLEGETRAKLVLADLFDSLGNFQAAKRLSEGAVIVARAMGYSRLESHAMEYLQNSTVFQQFQEALAKRRAVDEDVHVADESDEKVRKIARFVLDSLGLPAERLTVVERDADATRQIARERIDFCRHIQLIQDLRHMQNQATCYATDPPRACHCVKLEHSSTIRTVDPRAVIDSFKATYCDNCEERSPKGRSS